LIYRYVNSSYQFEKKIRELPSTGHYKDYPSVVIVGGGISGLSVVHKIKGYCDVTLLESKPTFGGNNYSGKYQIPMKFGVFLEKSSPHLMSLLKSLNIKPIYPRQGNIVPNYNGIFKTRSYWQNTQYLFNVLLPTYYKSRFSRQLDGKSTRQCFAMQDYIVRYFTKPIGGINMFTDSSDFGTLPASQTANYMIHTAYDNFMCLQGGNYVLIQRLVDTLQQEVTLVNNHKVKRIRHNQHLVSVDGTLTDSVVVCCQPHDAQKILDSQLEPHQSIFRCFTKVKCFSCLHRYAKVFDGLPSDTNLAYDTFKNHHYLHIDAYYYRLPHITKPRQYIVSYWYDSAPNLIPHQYIIEKSFTILSRIIPEKQIQLNKLLVAIKRDHQNIHLCNAAYYGFMWHEDACCMASSVSQAFTRVI
jgi:predicted NAD/FAD-binding protein